MDEITIQISPHPALGDMPITERTIRNWLLSLFQDAVTVPREGDAWLSSRAHWPAN